MRSHTPTLSKRINTPSLPPLPFQQIVGKNNIWAMLARQHQDSPTTALDWEEMEGLFCQQTASTPLSPAKATKESKDESDKKKKEPTEVSRGFGSVLQIGLRSDVFHFGFRH